MTILPFEKTVWTRTTHKSPCPVCGKAGWCEVSDDGLTVHCMRTPGDKEIEWRGGGWLHYVGGRRDFTSAQPPARGTKSHKGARREKEYGRGNEGRPDAATCPVHSPSSSPSSLSDLSVASGRLRTGETSSRTRAVLADADTLLLDATAGPEMRLALPDFADVVLDVPQALHVIQTTNALYTAETLSQPRAVERVSRAIEATIERVGSVRPVVFSRKRFNPDYAEVGANVLDVRAAGLRYGHFARHNKGLNDYADADLLAIVGHFSPPLDDIEARVLALRGDYLPQRATKGHEGGSENRIGEENVQAAVETCLIHSIGTSPTTSPLSASPSPFVALCGENSPSPSPSFSLRRYDWRGADGQGLARWCRAHADPDVQAAIQHATEANIWQTIGRGRAALRAADKPLVVLLLTALPITGLPVAELTDVVDIIGAQRITEAQRAALDAGRDAANAQRHADTIAKIEAAKAEMHAAGLVVASPRRVAEIAGVARSTLWTLGYSDGGRWLRLANMRDTYSLDVYISLHVCPAPPPAAYSQHQSQHEPDVGGASDVSSHCRVLPRPAPPDDYAPDRDPWDTP